ncbi:MAG: serine/threonine protein kinase [Sandaracinaceae bacterium]|nr:serine/threonine protein kinase [Sandaracinaceae bacterium]
MPATATEALTAHWRARGISPSSLSFAPDGTLSASDRHLTADAATLASAEMAAGDGAELVDEPLELGEELGRGGMGVVHLARQGALRREVAVKQLFDEERGLANLLKEAWVGGHLEHPNVVPVHTLAVGPRVVMKRVDGTSWRALLREAPAPGEDRLGRHLGVLSSVCDAIAFAHARGVLHLDLKPDNVMVGAFGEVYVLDWGLAAGHGPACPPWLPRASSLRAIAGTPDYMAPELAMGEGARIGPWTDVYLLGATLHEVVTGRPPHQAELPIQKLYQAYVSAPHPYGPDVPAELAALLHRAMHVEPSARFADVAALQDALRSFTAHREAAAFAEEARAAIDALDDVTPEGEALDEAAFFARLGACRFALREAEAGWPEHPDLPALERRLAERLAGHAMRLGRLELAEATLASLDPPHAALRARLDALLEEGRAARAHVAALEAMAHAEDLDAGHRFRSRLAIVLGALFVVINLVMGWAERAQVVSLGYPEMLATGLVSLALLGPFGVWQRRLVFLNRANAAIWWVCIGTFFAVQGLWVLGAHAEIPFRDALALTPLFYLLAFGAVTMLVSTRFFVSPLLQVPTAIAAALAPEHVYEIVGVGGGLGAAAIGLVYLAPRAVRA